MKILIISDKESPVLWEHFQKDVLDGIDLILSCGDLEPAYLSFLVSMFNGPVLYVHGNHDERYKKTPPEGCIDIDGRIYVHNGLRILGLGGSMRYKDGAFQYTEKQMQRRVNLVIPKIIMHGGFDVLLTHSPAYELDDGADLPHRGFAVFRRLIDRYSPRYMVHGHVHMSYGYNIKRTMHYKNTVIINGFEKYILDIPDEGLTAQE